MDFGTVFAAGLAVLAACAPANKSIVEVGEPQPFNPPPEVAGGGQGGAAAVTPLEFEAVEIKGTVFSPGALDLAELPGNGTTVKRSIADQRKRAGKAKGVAKLTESKDLALLLWYTEPKTEDAKEKRKLLKAQREEALAVLAPLGTDPTASEELVAAYAAAEQAIGDETKAAAAWDGLVTGFPKSAKLARYQALRNYLALKTRQPLPYPLPESLDAAPYEAAYASAWVKFRTGDKAGAVAAITVAAKGWKNLESLISLRRDVMLIYSRAGGAPEAAWALLEGLVAKDKGDMQKVGSAVADAYFFAGEYEGSAVLREKLAAGAPPVRLAEIRLGQALVHARLLRPAEAADAFIASWTALAAAGDAAPVELREAVAKQIVIYAQIFHSEYAKSRDKRFAEPAHKLYTTYLTIPGREDADKVKGELLPNLDATIKTYGDASAPAAVGALDQQIVQRRVAGYLEQVQACYEAELSGDPALVAEAKLTFAIGPDGKVTGAKVAGAGTDRGGPAVGRCVESHAEAWLFPASGGASKVSYPFAFKTAPAK